VSERVPVVNRILAITEAGDAYPSGFIRAGIYRDWFARSCYDVQYTYRLHPGLRTVLDWPSPLLAAAMRGRLGAPLFAFERALARVHESRILAAARCADVVYMSKITSYAFVRRLRAATHARLVLDFGDALWLPNRHNDRFDDLLATVDAVTTDNEMTAAHVRVHQPNCTVIHDCPQVEWFDRRRAEGGGAKPRDRVVIGWVGTPGTTFNLHVVWEALERIFERDRSLHLRLLGADPHQLPPFERVSWSLKPRYSQAEMIDEVLGMHIGLFPLQDVEACRVRGVLKATVYMSGGVSVIASPIGPIDRVVTPGVTGLLAQSTAEWVAALERLLANPACRTAMAEKGLDLVRREFTVERAFAQLRAVLDPATAAITGGGA
jgi:glycosyltransferase involved in cell wall biosynthesis